MANKWGGWPGEMLAIASCRWRMASARAWIGVGGIGAGVIWGTSPGLGEVGFKVGSPESQEVGICVWAFSLLLPARKACLLLC